MSPCGSGRDLKRISHISKISFCSLLILIFGRRFLPLLPSVPWCPHGCAPFTSRTLEFCFPHVFQEEELTGQQEEGTGAAMLLQRAGTSEFVLLLSPHLLHDLSVSVRGVGEVTGTVSGAGHGRTGRCEEGCLPLPRGISCQSAAAAGSLC